MQKDNPELRENLLSYFISRAEVVGGGGVLPAAGNQYNFLQDNGAAWISVPDRTFADDDADAFKWVDGGGLEYVRAVTTNLQPIIDFNAGGVDIDFHVRGVGGALADAFQVQASDGQITLGGLGAGFVQSTAGGVLSSAAIIAGDLPVHTHSGAGQGGSLVTGTTDTDAGVAEVFFAGAAGQLDSDSALTFSSENLKIIPVANNVSVFEIWEPGGGNIAMRYTTKASGVNWSFYRSGALHISMGFTTPTFRWNINQAVNMDARFSTGNVANMLFIDGGFDSVLVGGNTDLSSALGVTPTDTTDIGLVIRGTALQTASLLQLQESDGSVVVDFGDGLAVSEIVFNQQGEDIDTRFESANQTHMFFVDADVDVAGIRSSGPAAFADGLHVPWITGDAATTAYFGSTNAANSQTAVTAFSDSGIAMWAHSEDTHGIFGQNNAAGATVNGVWGNAQAGGRGVYGSSISGIGVQGASATGIAGRFDLTGAGTEILLCEDNGTRVFTVDDGGNIGIGNIAAPGNLLHVYKNGADVRLRIEEDAGTNLAGVWWRSGTKDVIADLTAGSLFNVYATDGDNVDFHFQANSSIDQLWLDKNGGNVGIGMTAPAAKLHVDQSDDAVTIPVLSLDQADLSEEFINFISTIGAGNPIDTAVVGLFYGKVRVAVNGTFKYVALYNS